MRACSSILIAALSAAGLGCATTTVDTYYAVQNPVVDEAFVKPDVDWSVYRSLRADPLNIVYVEGDEQPDPEDLERIRGYFRGAFLTALGDDYKIVTAPGPDVLDVHADLIDLKVNSPGLGELPFKKRLQSLVAKGQLTFVMELRDSVTREVLARAADQEKPSAGTEGESSWDEVERAAERWASLFRNWLDENLGKE